jgi:plastocyanin
MRPAPALLASLVLVILARGAGAETLPAIHIEIHDHTFVPAVVHAKAGQPIIWLNTDGDFHTVTSGAHNVDDNRWVSSPPIPDGQTFRVRLATPGTYPYFCKPHQFQASMHGTLIITRK